MTNLGGQKVLLTGAAGILGYSIAERIAARGGQLIALDINPSRLDALGERLEKQGRSVRTYLCDLSDRRCIYETAEKILSESSVDIVINNAGTVDGRLFLDLTDEAIDRTFAVNTLAPIWMTRAFLPHMISQGRGYLVNIASAAGLVGVPRLTSYCGSKFGMIGFHEALRVELKHQGLNNIQTTLVCPYYIDSELFRGVQSKFMPILDPGAVADQIVRGIERNRQLLLLPPFVSVVFPAKLLPPRIFDALLRFFGITSSMDGFRGRDGGS